MTGPTSAPLTPSDDDRLWAALAWVPVIGWIFAILILVMEERRQRTFQRFHAVNALAFGVAAWIVSTIVSLTGLGIIISCVLSIAILLYQIYMAIQAYNGQMTEVPGLTPFLRQQGWI